MSARADTAADRFLDITHLVCPMTFVRTKLVIEQMAPGQRLEIRLNAGEPLINVPRSVAEMGHVVIANRPEPGSDTVHRLVVELNPPPPARRGGGS